MDFSDVGTTLKKLDDLDSKLYTSDKSDVGNKSKNEKKDADFSDFGDSDSDDLGDLLNDDDDIFSKKKTSLLSKNTDGSAFQPSAEKKTGFLNLSPDKKVEGQQTKGSINLKNNFTKNESVDEVERINSPLYSFHETKSDSPLRSKPLKNTSIKSQLNKKIDKIDSFLSAETELVDDLGLRDSKFDTIMQSDFSKSESPKKSLKKGLSFHEDDEDIFGDKTDVLNSLSFDDASEKKTSRSFMDDLLGASEKSLSSTKKSSFSFDEKEDIFKGNLDDDDDVAEAVFGSHVPSFTSSAQSSRRKSVKFDDFPTPKFSKDSKVEGKLLTDSTNKISGNINYNKSFLNDNTLFQSEHGTTKSNEYSKTKKRSILSSSAPAKKEDNHLGILHDTATNKKNTLSNDSIGDNQMLQEQQRGSGGRRRSSGADWLGLSVSPQKQLQKNELKPGSNNISNRSDVTASSVIDQKPKPISLSKKKEENVSFNISQSVNSTSFPVAKVEAGVGASLPNESNSKSVSSSEANQLPANRSPTKATVNTLPQPVASPNFSVPSMQHHDHIQYADTFDAAKSGPVLLPSANSHVAHFPLPTSAESSNTFSILTSQLNELQKEREILLQASENMRKKSEEEIKSIGALYEEKMKIEKELFEQKIRKAQEEKDLEMQTLKTQLNHLENKMKKVTENYENKLANLEKNCKEEVQKLKELHRQAIFSLNQEHERAINRMKELKNQEVEAINSSQVYAKTLQNLSEQLEARAEDFAVLQTKLDERNQSVLQQKQVILEAKEKELKMFEARLHRQLEEGNEERTRLQQLILKLENRFQEQTRNSEEAYWEAQQLKTKLEVQKKFLEDDQKFKSQLLEKEKENLQKAQESLIQEQKTVFLQLAQERQQLNAEKIQLEKLTKRIKEDESCLITKKIQEECHSESQQRWLQEEENRLHTEKELFHQEQKKLKREWEMIEREKQNLKNEKEKFEDLKLELKRRAEEVEDMAMRAASENQEGRSSLAAARKIESDHHTRLNQLTKQMQAIIEKEKQLLQEKEKLIEEKREFESKKNSVLCCNCKLAINLPITALPPSIGHLQRNPPFVASITSQSHSDPNLMVWYLTAEKEQEFLQNELAFLQSLKDFKKSSM